MIHLPSQTIEILVNIYIGQNIRKEGILQSEFKEKDQLTVLLKEGLIFENHWYLNQFKTTEKGSEISGTIVKSRIEKRGEQLRRTIGDIPDRAMAFFMERFISKSLAFRTSRTSWANTWEDFVLVTPRIWVLWEKLFATLESLGLCVKAHDYVSTKGGRLLDLHFVISPETREFLEHSFSNTDLTSDQEKAIELYSVFRKLKKILSNDDLDLLRTQYHQLIRAAQISEERLAGIVDAMNKIGITSEYRGLLSVTKPFRILDANRFQIYLDKNLLDSAVGILLQEEKEIRVFVSSREISSFDKEMSRFYLLVSSFERRLRGFVKTKLGKGWEKRIENDLPQIVKKWGEREESDIKVGIEVEKERINYADLDDYVGIVKKYSRLFTDGEAELEDVKVKLKDWYRYGRNPIMHSRTCDRLKIATTESAVRFLEAWMARQESVKR